MFKEQQQMKNKILVGCMAAPGDTFALVSACFFCVVALWSARTYCCILFVALYRADFRPFLLCLRYVDTVCGYRSLVCAFVLCGKAKVQKRNEKK